MSFYSSTITYSLNGASYTTFGVYNFIISNNRTSIYFHDATTFAVLSSYNLNDTILQNFGYPLGHPSIPVTPHNIVICKNSIKLIYQSRIYLIKNMNSIFGIGVTATSAAFAR